MEENKNILADEQLDEVVETLEENKPIDVQLLNDIINNENNPGSNEELEEAMVDVAVNKVTGELMLTNEENELVEENAFTGEVKEITNGDIETAKSMYDLNEDEAAELLQIIIKFQADSDYKPYNDLPPTIKKYIDEFYVDAKNKIMSEDPSAPLNKITKDSITRFFLSEFVKDINMNREFVDLQTTIEKELQIPSISDLYTEHIKDVMEIKLLESADSLEEEFPDKAKALRDISNMFKDSYTFGLMRSTLINNKEARTRIRESCYEYSMYTREFNQRTTDILLKIDDVTKMTPVLNDILPEQYGIEDIKKFVVLFCKTAREMDVNNTVHCSYMYYTIKNIVALQYTSEAKTDFSINLIANIINMIDYINEVQSEVESTMPPKLLKSKIKKCNQRSR